MPYRNKNKHLFNGSTYHAYNRGYDKKTVFRDDEDYDAFIYYLRTYLERDFNVDNKIFKSRFSSKTVRFKLHNQLFLHGFCLMPNHFHLLLRQRYRDSMSKLLNRLTVRYTRYYNHKYGKSGRLWSDTYLAVLIKSEDQYLTTLNYIHQNPHDIGEDISTYKYSSGGLLNGVYDYKFVKKGLPFGRRVID